MRIYEKGKKKKIYQRFLYCLKCFLLSLNLLQTLQGQTSSLGVSLIYIQHCGCNERQFDPGIPLRLICRPLRLHSWPTVAVDCLLNSLLRSNYEQMSEN